MKTVADLVMRDDQPKIVVLSAVSGMTDRLIRLSQSAEAQGVELLDEMRGIYDGIIAELLESPGSREAAQRMVAGFLDELRAALHHPRPRDERWFVAFGELTSTGLFHLYMQARGTDAALIPALDFMRTREGEPDMPMIRSLLADVLHNAGEHALYITQGYICRNETGDVDNLRRGGSDYTATVIGAAIDAAEIQIWTDIDGVHNNDPRIVKQTRRVDELTYAEAAELAYFGAKILHPLCVRPARQAGVPIRLLNTLDPSAPGTVIRNDAVAGPGGPRAVAAKDGITAINIRSSHMLMAYGFLRRIFEVFEHHRTPVDMITTSEVAVSLTIDDTSRLDAIIADLSNIGTVTVDRDLSILCVVGSFRKEDKGIAVQVLEPLRSIPIRMISSGGSESNISVLVESRYKKEALEALNRGLFDQA
jgi:aspartate kinase